MKKHKVSGLKNISSLPLYLSIVLLCISVGVMVVMEVLKSRIGSNVVNYPVEVNRTIVVDHTSVELFDEIPDQYIRAAQLLNVVFSDRSVGVNIDDALDCLEYESDEVAPSRCRSYVSEEGKVSWNRPDGYNRANWKYGWFASSWSGMTNDFIRALESGSITYTFPTGETSTYRFQDLDVFAFQFSYLNIMAGDTIDDQPGGFVSNNPVSRSDPTGTHNDIYDLTRVLETRYPDKTFIYMTTSLARGIGTAEGMNFNEQLRDYVISQNKVLFDVADIESHDLYGNPCYDNRDGVQYCNSNRCENYADDGQNYPAICQDYTTETDGGHLGSMSTGGIRLAKAFWVLMAQLAGWNPGTVAPPSGNISPDASAGADQTVLDVDNSGREYVTLDGSGSRDPDGTVSSYVWREGTNIVGSEVRPRVNFSVGSHTITLTVMDNQSATDTDQVVIRVNAPSLASSTLHVGDIDGWYRVSGTGTQWFAGAKVYVHDQNHLPVEGVTVVGRITSTGAVVTSMYPTNSAGITHLQSGFMPLTTTSETITVTGMTKTGYTYSSTLNHDPDGSTNGILVTVRRN